MADGYVLGALSAVLLAVLASAIFPQRATAMLAPLVFVTTPMVAMAMRDSAPQAAQLPIVVGWLLALRLGSGTAWAPASTPTRKVRALGAPAGAGAVLGLGLYTHPGAVVTMPLLLMVGVIAALASGAGSEGRASRTGTAASLAMIAGFVVVALPLLIRYAANPSVFEAHVTSYGLYDASRFNVLQGMREMTSWVGLVARSEVYWDYFNPSLWFLSGGSLRNAAADPRAFLLPLAVLVPAGIYHVIASRPRAEALQLIGALLAVPVAASLTVQPPVPGRLLLASPIVALLAVHGARQLVSSPPAWRRGLGIAAAASVPLFFGFFVIG